jgi:hypothetical protein
MGGVAEMTLSHLRKSTGYKEPVLVKGIGEVSEQIRFQRIPKMILKYY